MALLAPGVHSSMHWRALRAWLQRGSSQDGLSEEHPIEALGKIKEGYLPFVYET